MFSWGWGRPESCRLGESSSREVHEGPILVSGIQRGVVNGDCRPYLDQGKRSFLNYLEDDGPHGEYRGGETVR